MFKIIKSFITACKLKRNKLTKLQQAAIKQRKAICNSCQFNSKNIPRYTLDAIEKIIASKYGTSICTECGCLIGSPDGGKEYCLECDCPKNKWFKISN